MGEPAGLAVALSGRMVGRATGTTGLEWRFVEI